MKKRLIQLFGSRESGRRVLIRGGAGIALIQAASRVLSLALGVVLARYLGAEGYGLYSYSLAWLVLLMVPAQVGMPTLLLREVSAREATRDWALVKGVLVFGGWSVLLASSTLACGVTLAWWFYCDGEFTVRTSTLFWAFSILPLAALARTTTSALRGLRHIVKAQFVEELTRPLLVLLGVAVLFYFAPEMRLPQVAMAVQAGAVFIVLCASGVMLYRCLPDPVKQARARYLGRSWLASALPLTIISGAGIINSQTDILMLGLFRPPDDVGIYRVATQGAALVAFGLQVANTLIAPQFAAMYAKGDMQRLQRLVTASARVITLSALPVALIFVFAGERIAGWIFGAEFMASYGSLAILSVGQLINAAIGSVGFLLNMTGHENDVARTLVFTAVINIVLNWILIPPFGTNGAATATAASLVLWNILLCRQVWKRIGINSTAFAWKKRVVTR